MAEKKTETTPPAADGKAAAAKVSTITKMEAVRRAIKGLGDSAGRADLQKYIHSHFKIDMTLDHISNYKGEIARRAKKGRRKPGRPKTKKAAVTAAKPVAAKPAAAKPAAKPAAAKPAAKPAAAAAVKGENVSLKAIEKAKDLLGLLKPGEAKRLIDVLSD